MRIMIVTKRTLIIVIAVLAALGLLTAALLAFTDGSASAPTSVAPAESYELAVLAGKRRELPVYSVLRTDKRIALTIDAAWEDDKTPFILETLAKYDIKATFFLCGFWVEDYPNEVKQIFEAGHQIGNHTSTHPHMNSLSAAQIKEELAAFDELVMEITGVAPTVFRAPYGEYNDLVITTSRELGYEPVQWDIDTQDWREGRTTQTILDSVVPALHPGCIILCHNNGFTIKEYLPVLIETALAEGYEFVTVEELLLDGAAIIDVNGVQKPAS